MNKRKQVTNGISIPIPKTYDVKKAFIDLVPPCQRVRNSLNNMEQAGREARRIQKEIETTEKILSLTDRSICNT